MLEIIVFGELCFFESELNTFTKNGDFSVECPSGYNGKGTFKITQGEFSSIGKGIDSQEKTIEYKLYRKKYGKSSKVEILIIVNSS